jgi:CRISPR-associated protein Csm2
MWRSTHKVDSAIRRLVLLKPKMAYQAARERKVKNLVNNLDEAISYVESAESPAEKKERFDKFVDLFEAILAYHKAKGGK